VFNAPYEIDLKFFWSGGYTGLIRIRTVFIENFYYLIPNTKLYLMCCEIMIVIMRLETRDFLSYIPCWSHEKRNSKRNFAAAALIFFLSYKELLVMDPDLVYWVSNRRAFLG
jgi:hypothetical protein